MDAMEELAFTEDAAEPHRVESSANYTQLPAILAFRMRLLGIRLGEEGI